VTRKLVCIVCGRKFPQGQGVVISIEGKEYTFHSKSCAIKFLRRVIDEAQELGIKRIMDSVEKEFIEELKRREELRKKVI